MWRMLTLASCVLTMASGVWGESVFEGGLIFDPETDNHGHVHASCVVECPNGDLLAVWYENGEALPAPYYSKDGDKSDDVRIGGARKRAGAAAWGVPFVAHDTFGVSDNNPCMVIDRAARLWLFHPTLMTVPENSWGSGLVQYHVSTNYQGPGAPKWDRESILVVRPMGFEKALMASFDKRAQERNYSEDRRQKTLDRVKKRLADPFKRRFGWMSRAHPIIRSDGALLLPLANENYSIATMVWTNDAGATWTVGEAVPGTGVIQPSVVEFEDGAMAAFFRDGTAAHRIQRSDSADGGQTWGPITATELPNPGAGIEAVLLKNGHLAMIYNDQESSPRDRLAVSISTDRGETWRWTRHIENTPGKRFDYPSLIQSHDGSLHATYSLNTRAIKHAHFNEEWIQQGD